MISIFGLRYQSNFCAECGNLRAAHRWWEHSYLCPDCAARRGYRRRLLIGCAVIGLSLFAFAQTLRRPLMPVAAPTVSAFDAVGDAKQNAEVKNRVEAEKPERTACGARTLRGTPCKRMVARGERCAQHKGRASILAEEQPQKTRDSRK